MEIEIDKAYNCDCKELLTEMQKLGIKADWCITDPPYGLSIGKMTFTLHKPEKSNAKAAKRDYVGAADWDGDRLSNDYFDLIFSTSTNQIIFGGGIITRTFCPRPKVGLCGIRDCHINAIEMILPIVNLLGVAKVLLVFLIICITGCYKKTKSIRIFGSTLRKSQHSYGINC